MLSYRHHYHAGNFADVIKHFALFCALDYLKHKDKGILYMDTHAGAGFYQLDDKNQEYADGMGKFFAAAEELLSPELLDFRNYLLSLPERGILPAGTVAGSALIAASMLRDQDSLYLCEMHSSDFPVLQKCIDNLRSRRCVVSQSDGFHAVKAALPPPSRRALILIDPSYEVKQDYKRSITAIQDAIKRLHSAVIILWYPILRREIPESERFIPQLKNWTEEAKIPYHQQIFSPQNNPNNMYACGLLTLNPPFQYEEKLSTAVQILEKIL